MRIADTYLVFDFETTGLDPAVERIIQVGLCRVSHGRVADRRAWLVNQDVNVPPDATRIHGITTGAIRARGLSPKRSMAELFGAMKNAPFCLGHNIHRFDVPFMRAESRRLGITPPNCAQFIDTAAIFKGRKLGLLKAPDEDFERYAERVLSIAVPGLRYSVHACLTELGIQVDPSQLHDAGNDAYFTHLIFQHLTRTIRRDPVSAQQ